MNGSDIKKAASNKIKQVASAANNAANGNGTQRKKKGTGLKPIITTEDQQAADLSPKSVMKMNSSRSVTRVLVYPPDVRQHSAIDCCVVPTRPFPTTGISLAGRLHPHHPKTKPRISQLRKKTRRTTAKVVTIPSALAKPSKTVGTSSHESWDGAISRLSGSHGIQLRASMLP